MALLKEEITKADKEKKASSKAGSQESSPTKSKNDSRISLGDDMSHVKELIRTTFLKFMNSIFQG